MAVLKFKDPATGNMVALEVGGGAAVITVHNDMTGRDAPDAHPQGSITGLVESLNSLVTAINTLQTIVESQAVILATKAEVTISATAPSLPQNGDIWIVP